MTGADGFVGRALCRRLVEDGWQVRGLVRGSTPPEVRGDPSLPVGRSERRAVGNLETADRRGLAAVLAGAEVLFHVAGRAHRRSGQDQDRQYMADNLAPTRRLAEAAVAAGLAKFVYVSSIKAIAHVSVEPLPAAATPAPPDAYGRSKLAAERCLAELAAGAPISVSVVRPPLVHGPGVKGNLAVLLKALSRGVPMPLGCARAPRSMVGLDNLCDLLRRLADQEDAYRVYHVRDDEDLTVVDLISICARLLGRKPRLFNVPSRWLRRFDRLAGTDLHARLFAPLRVDDAATRQHLQWRPPVPVDSGLAQMVAAIRADR